MRLLAAAVVVLGLIAGCQHVPYTNRSHLMLISDGQEKGLGTDAYKETLAKSKLSTDQEKIQLVRKVGHRIAKAANRPDYQWEFNVIEDDKQINAWCLPGGKVAFYTGIFPVAQGEDGIAVVMGHEVSHALARHGGERMSQGMIAQFGGQALSLLLSDKPAQTRELFGQAYGLGIGLGVLLPYSRAQEAEADHIGLILMSKAGYDPHAAIDFWGRMDKAHQTEGKDSPLAKYLSTHPPSKERQDKIRDWIPEAMKYYKPDTSGPQ